ncbi:MAG TPA: hypothetical protein PLH68_04825, partial [Anaerolineaceae bacterium]|nr:hypothetical protein [Anaerolineaceae bacterium]
MADFLKWYLFAFCISWINLPLTFRLFKALPSRGYALSRPLGLLLWGYLFWLLTSLKLLNNDQAGQLSALLLLVGLNAAFLGRGGLKNLAGWLRGNRKLVLCVEGLFLVG